VLGVTRERFYDTVNSGSFSVLTAANPGHTISPRENQKRMLDLYEELNRKGIAYMPTVGRYLFGDKDAKPEPSVMIPHTAHFGIAAAREMGKRLGQESVMHSIKGHAQVVYTNIPERHPEWGVGGVRYSGGDPNKPHATLDSTATDAYTGHQGNKFSYDFGDWDAPPVKEGTSADRVKNAFGH
jgi:hypothetical protein